MREFMGLQSLSETGRKHLDTLRLSIPFTEDDLKEAFRKRSFETHPDSPLNESKNGDEFRKVKEAYEYLGAFTSEEITPEKIEEMEWQRTKIEEQEPFKNFADCPRCQGKGRWIVDIKVPIYSEDGDKCPKCDGTGKYTVECRACKGTGKFTQRSGRTVDCRTCNGTGRFTTTKPCYHCDATGYIDDPYGWRNLWARTRSIKGYRTEPSRQYCSSCKGTGRVEILNPVLKKGVVSSGKKRKK